MRWTMTDESDKLRQDLVSSFRAYSEALRKFVSEGVDRVGLVRKIMKEDRNVALTLAEYLSESEHKQLFNLWVGGASHHKYVSLYRKFILALPRDWVLERVEAVAEPHLINGDLEEYARYLELYLLLDEELTRKLAQRALAHSDPDVVEAGQDFIEILGDENRIKETRERLAPD
jgi:hypothetical protein